MNMERYYSENNTKLFKKSIYNFFAARNTFLETNSEECLIENEILNVDKVEECVFEDEFFHMEDDAI